MNKISLLYIIFSLCVVFAGCYKDFEREQIDTKQDAPEIIIDHNLVGQVITENNTLADNIIVNYNDEQIDPTTRSFFYFEAKQVNQFSELIDIFYKGIHIPYLKAMVPNETNYTRIIVPDQITEEWIDPMKKFSNDFGGISCHIEANSIRLGGEDVSETTNFFFSSLSYTTEGLYPGGNQIHSTSEELMLNAKQYYIIESEDEFTFKGHFENVEEDLFHYDDGLKAWVLIPENEDGNHQISNTGIYAEGISTPFVKIEGTLLTPDGLPLNGESVIFQHDFGSISTFTTASGNYISKLPQKSKVFYSVSNLCSNLNENIQTDTEDLKLNSLNLEIPFDEIYLIKGQARGCSNDPLTQESFVFYSIEGENSIISNTVLSDFRIVHAPVATADGKAIIGKDAAAALRVQAGDQVRVVYELIDQRD